MNSRRNQRRGVPAKSNSYMKAIIGLLLIAVLLSFIYWYQHSKPPTFLLLAGVDWSGSTEDKRADYLKRLDIVVQDVIPTESSASIFGYDDKVEMVDKIDPNDDQSINIFLDKAHSYILKHRTPDKGTYQVRPLEVMLPLVQHASNKGDPVAIMLLTDGEDWDQAATRRAAMQLAQVPNLKAVWVVPVNTGLDPNGKATFRARIESTFAPLGNKLIVSNKFDINKGQADFTDRIRN